MEFREPVVTDLKRHKVLRDDSHGLAARPQHRVREHTHQTHIAAAVHQSNVSSHQCRAHLLGGGAVLGAAAGTGAAENADSFHAAILNFASASRTALVRLPPIAGGRIITHTHGAYLGNLVSPRK